MDVVYPDKCPDEFTGKLTSLLNEPLSFQLAFMNDEDASFRVNVVVESALPINLYSVGNVIVNRYNDYVVDKSRHYCPDMLLPLNYKGKIENHPYPWSDYYLQAENRYYVNAYNDEWNTLWLTVNESGKNLKPGVYPISVKFINTHNELIHEFKTDITILDKKLPPQKLPVTQWFYCDCLSDYYRTEVFSEEFFKIMENYLKVAVNNGMNMVLVPAFTPPLDVGIGRERKKTQLVKVTITDTGYEFDFSLLDKFIDVAKKSGITYFEHSHLFTQWGAKHAPAIYANVKNKDGKYVEKEIFGWKTDASKPKYINFVRAYMKAFREYAKGKKIISKTLIHISDEPMTRYGDGYEKAYTAIKDYLDGFMQGDALSEYSYYEKGYVKAPIAVTDEIENFYGKCDHLWCYYTSLQTQKGCSNSVLGYEHEKNRALGYQMYMYNVEGFLNWGYNCWYNVMSRGLSDPKSQTNTFGLSAGSSFLVYPENDGTPIQSIRHKVFGEGIRDFRALKLLEKEKGRKTCEKLVEKHFGKVTFQTLPTGPKQMLAFRAELNDMLCK